MGARSAGRAISPGPPTCVPSGRARRTGAAWPLWGAARKLADRTRHSVLEQPRPATREIGTAPVSVSPSGAQEAAMSEGYVRTLFDGYAVSFDNAFVGSASGAGTDVGRYRRRVRRSSRPRSIWAAAPLGAAFRRVISHGSICRRLRSRRRAPEYLRPAGRRRGRRLSARGCRSRALRYPRRRSVRLSRRYRPGAGKLRCPRRMADRFQRRDPPRRRSDPARYLRYAHGVAHVRAALAAAKLTPVIGICVEPQREGRQRPA